MLRVSDSTYVETLAGFAFAAFVIDIYARWIADGRASRTAHACTRI
jgi:putative transposase